MTPRWNLPWLALAILLMVSGVLAGLMRIGWDLPPLSPGLLADHGPLMLTGFLGTLITLERAVAIGLRRYTLGAACFAAGGLLILSGLADLPGKILTVLGSAGLAAIFVRILRQHRADYTWVMAAGAAFLLAGSVLWASGWSPALVVPWWTAFLVLTIAGERLELGRLLAPSPAGRRLFAAAALVFCGGVVSTAFNFDLGTRMYGAGMIGLAFWHLRFDVATRTIRKPGLTRFIAVCMLAAYAWLLVSGLLGLAFGAKLAGPVYDAQIHSLFLGFVFSMIFGHAPIIFPAILGRQIRYHPRFYAHVLLLHASLLLRLWGDFAGLPELRQWGGMLNGVALLAFLLNTVAAVLAGRKSSG